MENNNVTTEDLARMIQNGFNETAKKVDVDQRFDIIEERLDRIEKLETNMTELRQALALK
ncbi:hypothetical protein KKA24_02505 [Patescibacteria group bacterium]|nr:hypothetical protein [Patescibacteria group bacterium]